MTELPDYRQIMRKLLDAGYQAYVVGGTVRDAYIGRKPKDYDIVTDATPNQVLDLFDGSRIINANFSVAVYVPSSEDGGFVEVTTMRSESDLDYANGKPAKYVFASDIKADLARRDATMNAMAMDIDGNITDPFDGREDIKPKKVVAVGNPVERITAPPIRMMRYAGFGTSFDEVFAIEAELVDAIIKHRRLIATESWEAIAKELMKGLASNNSEKYMLTLKHLGILEVILPEVFATVGVMQNAYHANKSVWNHTLLSLRSADVLGLTPVEKLGVLLHDVGKPPVREYKGETYGYSFHGHESVGMSMAQSIAVRMKLSDEDRTKVALAVGYHMYPAATRRQAKKLLKKLDVGGNTPKEIIRERADFLMMVRFADTKGASQEKDIEQLHKERAAYLQLLDILDEEEPFRVTDLAINGNDVMEELDMAQGRAVGHVLNELLSLVVSGEIENKKGALIDEARRIHGIVDDAAVAEGV